MTGPLDPKFHTSHARENNKVFGSIVTVSEIIFHQTGNINSPISLDLSQKLIPAELLENLNFSLALTLELNEVGKAVITQYSDQLISCQVQTFAKPLSPMRSGQHWKSSLSTTLFPQRDKYCVEFQPISMANGIYSLQLLLLVSNLRSSPVLLEIPAFQVIEQPSI